MRNRQPVSPCLQTASSTPISVACLSVFTRVFECSLTRQNVYLHEKEAKNEFDSCKVTFFSPYPSPAGIKASIWNGRCRSGQKNHPHFIIRLLSADSLLVDIYIFFMGTPCNLLRMFSPCTNIPPAIMIYYIILLLNICDFTD